MQTIANLYIIAATMSRTHRIRYIAGFSITGILLIVVTYILLPQTQHKPQTALGFPEIEPVYALSSVEIAQENIDTSMLIPSVRALDAIFITPTPTASPSATPSPTHTPMPTPEPSLTPLPTHTPLPTPKPLTSGELDGWFQKYSSEYSIDRNLLFGIAACESGLNPQATNGPYGGMYQFAASSWQSTRAQMNLDTNPDLRFNAEESIRTAAFKISINGTGAWPNCP